MRSSPLSAPGCIPQRWQWRQWQRHQQQTALPALVSATAAATATRRHRLPARPWSSFRRCGGLQLAL